VWCVNLWLFSCKAGLNPRGTFAAHQAASAGPFSIGIQHASSRNTCPTCALCHVPVWVLDIVLLRHEKCLGPPCITYIEVQEGSSGWEVWAPKVLEFIFRPGFPMFYPFHLNEAVWKRVSRLIGLQLLLSWAGAIHAIGFAGHIHEKSQMRTMSETSR